MKFKKLLTVTALSMMMATAFAADKVPLQIAEQGSFTVGGSYVMHEGTFSQENFIAPNGQRAYGDFAYVKYQKPVAAKKLPLIFQHGGAQSSRTWETTVDGREGFDTLFVRKGFDVYLLDQPRNGKANLSTKALDPATPWASNPMYGDKTFYILSRVGHFEGEKAVPNAQFPEGEAAYQGFQQAWTIGWRAAMRSPNVKAIVAYEPGGTPFVFPETEMPKITKAKFEHLSATAIGVPMGDFKKLTQIPIVLYYGDYIKLGSDNVGEDKWGTEFAMAKQFVDAINRHGGDATLVHLPEIGIKGNSHFLMGEKNNAQLADLMESWLKEKGLDK